ncbi:MAG TPA: copper transporter [Nocardioidaceae bacterium]
MTALRRWVFPILVALLAFAIGIALGGGPLQTDEGGETDAGLARDKQALQDDVASLRSDRTFDDGLSQALSARLLDKRLEGRSVTLVVLPGIDERSVAATEQDVKLAGADVPVVVRLDDGLLNPGKKTYVDSVATNSLKGASDLASLAGASTYERAGALVARAYAGKGNNADVDDEAARIDSELQGAELVAVDGTPIRRGTFVVVLAPGEHGQDSFTRAQMVIAGDLVTALVHGSDAVVVGSSPTSSQSGGLIDVLTADQDLASTRLSTINVADSPAGRIALVYALAAAASGAPGHYGVDGDEAVLPPGLAPNDD